jgi:four helix bundle protein
MKRSEEREHSYQTFEDLEVYQVAREFRKAMYRVAKQLPETEKPGLISQVRRASLSLTNSIAEGHGRFHFLDQIKFMLQSRGSLEELMDDLNTCDDETYLATAEIEKLKREAWRVHKLINGYIRFLRSRIPGDSSHVKETSSDEITDDESSAELSGRFNSSTLQQFNE